MCAGQAVEKQKAGSETIAEMNRIPEQNLQVYVLFQMVTLSYFY